MVGRGQQIVHIGGIGGDAIGIAVVVGVGGAEGSCDWSPGIRVAPRDGKHHPVVSAASGSPRHGAPAMRLASSTMCAPFGRPEQRGQLIVLKRRITRSDHGPVALTVTWARTATAAGPRIGSSPGQPRQRLTRGWCRPSSRWPYDRSR